MAQGGHPEFKTQCLKRKKKKRSGEQKDHGSRPSWAKKFIWINKSWVWWFTPVIPAIWRNISRGTDTVCLTLFKK
jgi:hypothetical protein